MRKLRQEELAQFLLFPLLCFLVWRLYYPLQWYASQQKKELEFFCKRYEVAICDSCVATIHDGHAKILLEEAANECKLRIKGFVESQKKAIQQKKNDIDKTDRKCHKIWVQVGKVKRDVEAFSDKIIAAVVDKKEEIFFEVENQAKETLQRQGIQKNEIEQQLKTMNAPVGRTETILKRNSSAGVDKTNTGQDHGPDHGSDHGPDHGSDHRKNNNKVLKKKNPKKPNRLWDNK